MRTIMQSTGNSTRGRAVRAVEEIFRKGKKPKESLEAISNDEDKRERAFLMELVYGVLRYRDYLDWMLKDFLKNPLRLPSRTLHNLRLAIYQMQFMRVPEWAVVHEAVDIEKDHGGKAGLVNAVLRNFLRHRAEIVPPPREDAVRCTAITTSHSRWLVKRWFKRFGPDEAQKLAEKNNEAPALTVRLDNESERAQALQFLAEKNIEARATDSSPAGITFKTLRSFTELSAIFPFRCSVQDEAAQLITYLLNPLPGERVLDACAAPGGKTTHIAQAMKDSGEVVAVEADVKRIGQLQENIKRLDKKSVRIIQGDVRSLRDIGTFDKVLLDAPCSALGVIRRNPDVKYRYAEKDLLRFQQRQVELIHAASQFLKSGGSMVYSVCSTEPEEGEEVIKKFLQDHHNFSMIEGDFAFLQPFKTVDREGRFYWRTYPHRDRMDGFFAARLRTTG